MAHALGGEVVGRNTVLAPGPGHTARDRSLSVCLDPSAPDGFLVFSHSGDCWKLCRDHVCAKLGLPPWQPGDEHNRTVPPQHTAKWDQAATEAENQGPRAWSEDELLRIQRARAIWDEGSDPRGTLVEKYLRDFRRLDLPDDLACKVLRFHPHCPWRNEDTGRTERVPALVAAFRSLDNDAITAVHRIALNADGSKLGRRMLGIVHRSAIKFDPLGNELSVGEGIETAMAARQLGFKPAWALGSVGAVSFFPVMDNVKRLVILGEQGEASQNAMRICGKRWRNAGRTVRAVVPKVGSDLNDVVIARAAR
jgi:putative DNA primase/helicase